ncbi:Ankyrin-1 [Dactylella cylindrospora]|nr:Ankyrin-1 [Dactylella cylindrospora]
MLTGCSTISTYLEEAWLDMGGLVVKRALVIAKLNNKYRDIKDSCFGLIFFATPHQGGNHANLGKIARNIILAFTGDPKNPLIDALQKNSHFTEEQAETFRHQFEDYRILSFVETLKTPLSRGSWRMSLQTVIVDRKSATLGLSGEREEIQLLNKDHIGICKFSSDINDFRNVGANIRIIHDEAVEKVRRNRAQSQAQVRELISRESSGFSRDSDNAIASIADMLKTAILTHRQVIQSPGGTSRSFDYSTFSSLHEAVRDEDCELCESLIKKGHSLEAIWNTGFKGVQLTPLQLSIYGRSTAIFDLLVQHGADTSVLCGRDEDSLLVLAVRVAPIELFHCTLDLTRADLNKANKLGMTPVYCTIQENSIQQKLEDLLSWGADPNIGDVAGATPLHLAVQKNMFDAAKMLIKFNADTNMRTSTGITPLHLAASGAMARMLLENGADPHSAATGRSLDQTSDSGLTPLRAAVENGCKDVADELLKWISAKDEQKQGDWSKTAEDMAAQAEDMAMKAGLPSLARMINITAINAGGMGRESGMPFGWAFGSQPVADSGRVSETL